MPNAVKLPLDIVDIFSTDVCTGISIGEQWKIIKSNDALTEFLQCSHAELANESLLFALDRIGADSVVDNITKSECNKNIIIQHQAHRYFFIWTYIDCSELDNSVFARNITDEKQELVGQGEKLRYFTFYKISTPEVYSNYDLILRELEVILDSVCDGIWVIDASGTTLYINPAMERIAGISAKDVIGRHVTAPMIEGKFSSCVTLKALEDKKTVTMFDDYASGKRYLNTSTPIFDLHGNIWRVVASIRDMSELEALQQQLADLEFEAKIYKDKLEKIEESNTRSFIGKSAVMCKCLNELNKAAKAASIVLILGETGTGKTLAASIVHQKSNRSKGPFITVNCAAIPQSLLEAELFGYEKGAFTGASNEGKKGFFELANNGTLFLDEIGELPLSMQAKLLHVLDNSSFHRVGGVKNVKVDVRILTATNKPIEKLINSGEFRADLYYRLRVLSVNIPPLRERPEDIPFLIEHFLSEACKLHGTIKIFDPKTLNYFNSHKWPGNVRELRAIVEFLVVMTSSSVIKLRDLPQHLCLEVSEDSTIKVKTQNLKKATSDLEYKLIKEALEQTGSTYKAAAILGVSQSTVVRKAHRLKIFVPED